MQNVRVELTIPNVENVANLDVIVNGEHRHLRFRVERFDWNSETGSSEDLIIQLRDRIKHYDRDWVLYHIGAPHENKIPITFKYNPLRI
ncbi:MAG TPA: hypothetical protein VJ964_01530 [Balneolaceae bacterium]|nr:hypothetical protein [Balneolaceae bacterium]